jgi:hypothetical protein
MLLLVASGARAQESAQDWQGSVTFSEASGTDATFRVTVDGDVLGAITMVYAGEEFAFEKLEHAGTRVAFSFRPGPDLLECALEQEDDGSYAGQCPPNVPESQVLVRITMVPPA